MVGRLLAGLVWLNLQFSVSWQVDFQWGSCGSIFCFLRHGRQTFSGVRVVQSLVFCVMVDRLLGGFVWLNRQFSVSWQEDFQWGSCGSIQFSVSWLVDFQLGSCGSIFRFLCHGRETFSGARVAQSLVFCVMVGRLLVGFVLLNLQFSVSWQVDFQWGSCGSIFSFVSWQVDFQWGSCGSIFSFLCHGRQIFSGVRATLSLVLCHGRQTFSGVRVAQSLVLCHGKQTFSGVRVAQSLVFCVMVGRLLGRFVWLNFQFCVMVGRLVLGFVWLNLQFSVPWQVEVQWGSCGSIFSFLCHDWQTFSGVRVTQSLVFCVMIGRLLVGFVWLHLQFCVMVGRLLVGFVWFNLQFSVMEGRLLVGFVWFNLQFCVMVGRLLVGLVWLNLQFSLSWQVDFQWGSCGSIFSFVSWQVDFQWASCGSIFFLVFFAMVGRRLVGFVWLNLQFSVS